MLVAAKELYSFCSLNVNNEQDVCSCRHFLSQRRLDLAKDARGRADRETVRDGEEIVVRYLRPFAVNGQLMLSAVRRPWIVRREFRPCKIVCRRKLPFATFFQHE